MQPDSTAVHTRTWAMCMTAQPNWRYWRQFRKNPGELYWTSVPNRSAVDASSVRSGPGAVSRSTSAGALLARIGVYSFMSAFVNRLPNASLK